MIAIAHVVGQSGGFYQVWLALRLALRQLRGGLRGLYVLVACIALGVAAMVGIGGIGDAIKAALDTHGRELLGGDVSAARMHLRASPGERTALDRFGRVSEVAALRAMARTTASIGVPTRQALVELKAVDAAYPLVGDLLLNEGGSLGQALQRSGTAVCDRLLLERLGLKIGDRVMVGSADIELTGSIQSEPDKLSGQAIYGPRLLVSTATLEASGLAATGSLVRWQYKIITGGGAATPDATSLKALASRITAELPKAGFLVTTRADPIPGVRRAVERLGQFLTLVGFTTLGIGGLGVANAVASHLARMRKTIATLRSLGANDGQIFGIYLAQVLILALAGIAIGLLAGAWVPDLVIGTLGRMLPIDIGAVHRPETFTLAAVYGLLMALLFTLWPLGRAEQVRATALFRDEIRPTRWVLPRWSYVGATIVLACALVGLLLAQAADRMLAAFSAGGLGLLAGVLLATGWLVEVLVRRLPRFGAPELRVALGNIGGPQSLARPVMLSLGCGLGLLAALALIDHGLEHELAVSAPANAPNYYLLDVGRSQLDGLEALFNRVASGARFDAAPMLRGRVISLKGRPVEELQPPRDAEWFLQGDRGLTYADEMPGGTALVSGEWWPKTYAGPPLLSLDEDIAKAFGLAIGDSVVVNVLGRQIETRIANLRKIAWERLAINVTMILSPEPLRGAPHNLMATASYAAPLPIDREGRLLQAIADDFPNVAAIRVKDGLDLAASIVSRVVMAVRVAALVTLSAGALVLGGAMAAARRRRSYQAVVLKVLGATTGKIVAIVMLEYLLLAIVSALVALSLGTLAAWLVLHYAMQIDFVFSWSAVLMSLGTAVALVLGFGTLGTFQVLRARPVPYLRSE